MVSKPPSHTIDSGGSIFRCFSFVSSLVSFQFSISFCFEGMLRRFHHRERFHPNSVRTSPIQCFFVGFLGSRTSIFHLGFFDFSLLRVSRSKFGLGRGQVFGIVVLFHSIGAYSSLIFVLFTIMNNHEVFLGANMGVVGVAYYYRNQICAWFLSQTFSFLSLGTFFVHLFGCREITNKKRSDVVACERSDLSLLGLDFALELAFSGPSLSSLPLLLKTQILKVKNRFRLADYEHIIKHFRN